MIDLWMYRHASNGRLCIKKGRRRTSIYSELERANETTYQLYPLHVFVVDRRLCLVLVRTEQRGGDDHHNE
jgi:hypothetical protein